MLPEVYRARITHLAAEEGGGCPRVPRVGDDPLLEEAPREVHHQHRHRTVQTRLKLRLHVLQV